MPPTLIYCADGNKRFAAIALEHGLKYGARLPAKVYYNPFFADQDWRKPNKEKYMLALEQYTPTLATVLDWEHEYQYLEVMSWAEQTSQYVDTVIVIPKVIGGIKRLPRQINGKDIRLGYSAASSYAGTKVSLGEFKGYPVHCLGGSPSIQMDIHNKIGVLSADGNFIQQMSRKCQFYCPGYRGKNNNWPKLAEAGLQFIRQDAPYLAFNLTCIAVPMAWERRSGVEIYEAQLNYLDKIGIKPEYYRKPLL